MNLIKVSKEDLKAVIEYGQPCVFDQPRGMIGGEDFYPVKGYVLTSLALANQDGSFNLIKLDDCTKGLKEKFFPVPKRVFTDKEIDSFLVDLDCYLKRNGSPSLPISHLQDLRNMVRVKLEDKNGVDTKLRHI